jgi:hypothetical protein
MSATRKYMLKNLIKKQTSIKVVFIVLYIFTNSLFGTISFPVHVRDKTTTTATFSIDPFRSFTEAGYTIDVQLTIRDAFNKNSFPLSAFDPKCYSAKINLNSTQFILNNPGPSYSVN